MKVYYFYLPPASESACLVSRYDELLKAKGVVDLGLFVRALVKKLNAIRVGLDFTDKGERDTT